MYDEKFNEIESCPHATMRLYIPCEFSCPEYSILRKAKEVENFGNGRFVENMVQRIIIEHAKNTRYIDDYERLLTFTEEDVPDMKAEESRKRIGF